MPPDLATCNSDQRRRLPAYGRSQLGEPAARFQRRSPVEAVAERRARYGVEGTTATGVRPETLGIAAAFAASANAVFA